MNAKWKQFLSGETMMSLCIFILGIIWTVSGLRTGIWDRVTPGGGFMLVLVGIGLCIFSAMIVVQNLKSSRNFVGMSKSEKVTFLWILTAAVLCSVLMNYLLGTMITLTLFLLVWLKVFAKYSVIRTAVITVCTMGAIYCLFVLWLNVRFPTFLNWGYF